MSNSSGIKPIDKTSIHRITSGQVVVDLQTAVKELLENSIDAGSTNVEIRFKNYGLTSVEVIDNGSGIKEEDHDSIALKHHTSKLETFSDLTTVRTFGFRGEALSSLCALSEEMTVCTATSATAPRGVTLTMDTGGRVKAKSKVARTQGTAISMTNLFKPLPVRRKEFERNVKREFGKALSLLNAYALGPCAEAPGVRLTVSNQPDKGSKSVQIRTLGESSRRASVTALWGPRALENIADLNLKFEVDRERANVKRLHSQALDAEPISVRVEGLISKFALGCGRTGTDRQFFYINGRPCNLNKIQKAFNEVYRSFNATQNPFILANFLIPTDSYDVNVSPDKRTILLHSEGSLITALKTALEECYSSGRSTYAVGGGATQGPSTKSIQTLLTTQPTRQEKILRERFKRKDLSDELDDSQNSSRPVSPAQEDDLVEMASNTQKSVAEDNDDLVSGDSKDTPDDTMDVDDEPVIIDSSQTKWGRQMCISTTRSNTLSPPRPRPDPTDLDPLHSISPSTGVDRRLTSSPRILTLPKAQHEEPTTDSDDGVGSGSIRARKKRKSDRGPITSVRAESLYDEEKDERRADDEDNPNASGDDDHRAGSSTANKGSRGGYKAGSKIKISGSARKPGVSASQTLLSQLAGFARTGSRISSSASQATAASISEEVDEDEGRQEDEDEVEDVDENNDESSKLEDEVDELENDHHSGQEAVSHTTIRVNKTGPILKEKISSNRDAAVNQLVDLTIDKEDAEQADDDVDEEENSVSVLTQVLQSTSTTPSTISTKDMPSHPEVIKTDNYGRDIFMKINVDKIKRVWSHKLGQDQPQGSSSNDVGSEAVPTSVPADAGIANADDDAKAADALARVIEKQDFATMDIIGQFNLGFIIVRRQKQPTMEGGSQPLQIAD
ncbi:Mismatch repair endonuclease PMS2 [Psilocybe cubensis]|uniref:Mismatch repair endonuclease PMS2 n=1 Tax=Psilocybe cubensis TaxID=181762 RepID=A0ACB8H3V1_PSICU|nr:Mismatch repair endonuclease PMS2 [Psilocybe cubensis]KAH9481880.1 Mismatch repair endonuclease PMS2 [Psilocybe cubensis]